MDTIQSARINEYNQQKRSWVLNKETVTIIPLILQAFTLSRKFACSARMHVAFACRLRMIFGSEWL